MLLIVAVRFFFRHTVALGPMFVKNYLDLELWGGGHVPPGAPLDPPLNVVTICTCFYYDTVYNC